MISNGLRIAMYLMPEAANELSWIFLILTGISVVYGAFSACVQTDLKYINASALRVSGRKISATDIQHIIELGKSLLKMPIELLPGVKETLKTLKKTGKYGNYVYVHKHRHGVYRMPTRFRSDVRDMLHHRIIRSLHG